MPRSVNVVAARRRRKKVLKAARGFWGSRSKVFTIAKNTLEKGMQYAYRDRKVKKREFRDLMISLYNQFKDKKSLSEKQINILRNFR